MRIGIYTQPLRINYGGILQAWALQTVLKRMGHTVITFDPCPYLQLSWKRKPFTYTKRIVRHVLGKPTTLFYERKHNMEYDIKTQHIRPFVATNISRLEYKRTKELQANDYDVLIAGSDQVWRPRYNRSYGRSIENAFLDFAMDWNVKRMAYAASFGTDEWEFTEEQTRRCSALARQFVAVSVRESSGVALCRQHLGVDAVHVLDPTLLLSRGDYDALIEKGGNTHAPKGNLLCYILDESDDKNVLIDRIASSRHLTPFRANSRAEEKTADISEQVQPPIEQWLRDFREAEFVVTDSFHACVFSIIFGKPFVVIGNEKRGMSRFESLLSMFGLGTHLIASPSEYCPGNSYAVSNEVADLWETKKMESIKFLEESLQSW